MDPQQFFRQAKLTKRQIDCLALWCFDGLSLEEIGESLGLSKATVQGHIEEGRAKIEALGLAVPRMDMLEHPEVELRGDMDISEDEIKGQF